MKTIINFHIGNNSFITKKNTNNRIVNTSTHLHTIWNIYCAKKIHNTEQFKIQYLKIARRNPTDNSTVSSSFAAFTTSFSSKAYDRVFLQPMYGINCQFSTINIHVQSANANSRARLLDSRKCEKKSDGSGKRATVEKWPEKSLRIGTERDRIWIDPFVRNFR